MCQLHYSENNWRLLISVNQFFWQVWIYLCKRCANSQQGHFKSGHNSVEQNVYLPLSTTPSAIKRFDFFTVKTISKCICANRLYIRGEQATSFNWVPVNQNWLYVSLWRVSLCYLFSTLRFTIKAIIMCFLSKIL